MPQLSPNQQNLTQSHAAIGVFDSGVGGISVLQHIHDTLPHENLIYMADSLHAPYGNKTPQEITQRCFALAQYLVEHRVKALVVACNTATAAAIDALREKYTSPHFNFPIIGMEPAVKPAAAASKNGIVGVLATTGMLKSAQFAALLESYGRNVKVVTQACVGLVECVERGELQAVETKALIRQYCAPLLAEGADTIVLGCTHYPFVRAAIKEVVGEEVTLIDTGAAVAKQLKRQLEEADLQTNQTSLGEVRFFTNSPSEQAKQVIEMLWGRRAQVEFFCDIQ